MLIEAGQTPQSPALGESPVKARGVMVQFHPFRDVAKENIHGWIKGFLIGGGGSPNFGSEKIVELFCGKLLLTETTTCFSICERQSPMVQETLLGEQRQTDHRGVQLHF